MKFIKNNLNKCYEMNLDPIEDDRGFFQEFCVWKDFKLLSYVVLEESLWNGKSLNILEIVNKKSN